MSSPLDQNSSQLQLGDFGLTATVPEAELCAPETPAKPILQALPVTEHLDDPTKIIAVDPRRARVSALNPRNLKHLDQSNLEELRFVIEAVGQRSPAIVRRLADDPDYDFEILSGARRHRVVLDLCSKHHTVPLLVQVIDVTDVEAASIAEAANRGHQPLSEYERALYVRHKLDTLFGGNRRDLCVAFSLTDTRLSRLLSLADWPPTVTAAFGDASAIRQKDAAALHAILKGVNRDRALEEAKLIAAEQAERRREGADPVGAAEVRRRIITAVKAHVENLDVIDAATGQVVFTIRSQSRNGLMLFVPCHPADQFSRVEAMKEAVVRISKLAETGRLVSEHHSM